RMRHERCLYFGWRHPLAARLDHVVRAAAVDEVPVAVLLVLVAGVRPAAAERAQALLAIVPVRDRARRPADAQLPDRTAWKRPVLVVDDLHFVSRHGFSGRSVADVTRPEGKEDVQHLRRPDAIEDVDTVAFAPAQ